MNSFIYKTHTVPEDLSTVITIDSSQEVSPKHAGMSIEGVQAIWDSILDMYRTGIYPGISICMRRRGKIVLKRAIGHARGNGPDDPKICEKVLLTPDTPICQFSASKAVTAMIAHLLVERGAINLTDPISYYIPGFGFYGKENTTIYHILSHHGGIPTLPAKADPELLFDPEGFVRMLCDKKPDAPGGRRMAYHAITGGFIIGEIVQRVTGMNIRKFLRETIQRPLRFKYFNFGMDEEDMPKVAMNYSTGFPVVFPLSVVVKRALGAPWNDVVRVSNDPRFLKTIIPAGNLYANADEMCQFFELMLREGVLNGVRIFEPLTIRRAIMESDSMKLDPTMMVPMRYSAGMMLGASPVGMYGPYTSKAFGHLGFINIFCWADPERDLSCALLTTGKSLLGPHLMPLARFLSNTSWYCREGAGANEMTDAWCSYALPLSKILQSVFLTI